MTAAVATASAERVVNMRKTPTGPGQQYEVAWRDQAEMTWEAASRVRRQIPLLVKAYEEAQQKSNVPPGAAHDDVDGAAAADEDDEDEGVDREGSAPMEVDSPAAAYHAVAADGSSMLAQMEEMQRLLREQAQQLKELRASPAHSPQASPRSAPQSLAVPAAVAQPQPSSRFARKEPRAQDLREYDGASGAKLDEWLDELGAAVDLFHLNDREAVDFATSRLRGAARQWWNTLGVDRASINGAPSLGRGLRARFQPITAERTAREQLRALRQSSRGINEYIAEFQRLHALLPDMSEADALFAFESGANPAIALELRKQGSARLTDAIALAARVGGITAAASSSIPYGRQAAVNQMDIDDGVDGASRLDRIEAALNALTSARAQGDSARAQADRGTPMRERGNVPNRGGARRGRGGRFGGRGGGFAVYSIPGVPAAVVDQRRAAGQCLRCGSGDHRGMECPNAPSATQPPRSSN
jgi:hypothetical protein